MIALDKRLAEVLEEIKPCKCLADIGSDHGKIAIAARQADKADKIIASDISAPSVLKCRIAAERLGVDGIEIRVGDGVTVLSGDEYDTVVIAGIGAREIIDILGKRKKNFLRYILLPHRNAEILRVYLSEENIAPYTDKKVFCAGKYYDLIAAEHGEYHPDERTVLYGSGTGADYPGFAASQRAKIEKLIDVVSEDKKKEYLKQLSLLKETDV